MSATCGIIEDEPLGRELLIRYIARIPSLELKWVKESVQDLPPDEEMLDNLVDLIFLDLMNDDSGQQDYNFTALEKYGHIILTTAYPEEFVKTLPVRYLALLNKPVLFDRFKDTVTIALRQLAAIR